jgi:hypothetical protein
MLLSGLWQLQTGRSAPVFRNKAQFQESIKEDQMSRECSTNGEKRNAYRILAGKPEGIRPLGRPRCRCVNNIKMNLKRDMMG